MQRLLAHITTCLLCITASAQWSSNPAENLLCWPDGASYNYTELAMGGDGTSWLMVNYPGGENGAATKLVAVDTTGVKLFGEEGLTISTHPNLAWTYYNHCLFVDRDNNAIVIVNDTRHTPADTTITTGSPYGMTYYQSGIFGAGSGLLSYTAYKVSPQGEMLWGEDGISIDGGASHTLTSGVQAIQLEDGSYVFAWSRANGSAMVIDLARIDNDGTMLWSPGEVSLADPEQKVSYRDAYLVNAGYNQFILVYTKGSAQDVYARKMDFDGSALWSEDTRIYRSGWGSIPVWTILDVQPSGDGGVVVAWNDDRYNTGYESAYMSYVKPNGELGFATDGDGQRLGYADYRALSVKCHYDPATDSFIACWRECNNGQTAYRMTAQRVSKEGELLWGENGLELEPYNTGTYAYPSIQMGRDGEVVFFYMYRHDNSFGDVDAYAKLLDSESGESLWEEPTYIFTLCDEKTEKTNLRSTVMHNNGFWTVRWHDDGPLGSEEDIERIYMQRVNRNRSIGNPEGAAVNLPQYSHHDAHFGSYIDSGYVFFDINMKKNSHVLINIYNLNGKFVAQPFNGYLTSGNHIIECGENCEAGAYIAVLKTNQSTQTIKLIMR